jgi:circadian clock protein KaiB
LNDAADDIFHTTSVRQRTYKPSALGVLKHPLRAMEQGVRVTPTLAKLSPGPIANVVGNLSDKLKVLIALGLAPKTS